MLLTDKQIHELISQNETGETSINQNENQTKKINNENIPLYSFNIIGANILNLTVGTNGLQLTDDGKQVISGFSIKDVDGSEIVSSNHDNEGVTMNLAGDSELQTLIVAFQLAHDVLSAMK